MSAFFLIFIALGLRVYRITINKPSEVASQGKSKTIRVADSRGCIYDRNGERLVADSERFFAVLKPNITSIAMLGSVLSDGELTELFSEIGKEEPLLVSIPRPMVDTADLKVLQTFQRYPTKMSAAHIIGYLDSSKTKGISGIEKSFDELLQAASGKLSASFVISGLGRVMEGEEIQIKNKNYNSPAGVELTIDKAIQLAAENAMSNNNINKGAVVILDVETSAILASASSPAFNPNNLAAAMESPDSPFINRALTPYSVGSVYKPLVASAAIEQGYSTDYTYYCSGNIRLKDVLFHCHKRDGHGEIDMNTAIALSCNCFFIHLSSEIGKMSILDFSKRMGLGESLILAPDIISEAGILPAAEDLKNPGDLANLSFGQGKLLATPMQIAAIYACYANDGFYNEPFLLQKQIDGSGEVAAYFIPNEGRRIMSKHISDLTKKMLELTVSEGSGKAAQPKNSTAAGKTATAQSGWYEDGKEVLHTWFAGYFPADNPKYALVVMNEKGSYPSSECALTFKEIADEILKIYPLK